MRFVKSNLNVSFTMSFQYPMRFVKSNLNALCICSFQYPMRFVKSNFNAALQCSLILFLSVAYAPTPPTPTRSAPVNCQDNLFVRINSLPCEVFVAKNGLCDRPIVQQHCCGSCQAWNDLKK